MADVKTIPVATAEEVVPIKGSTTADHQEMMRMGKSQQLRRTFRFISIVGFVSLIQSSWEGVLLANQYGLFNGGTAGVIYACIGVFLCMLALIASLAEMASIAPTAGGQYHWVSEFAPPSMQGLLSYIVGWFCCLGWISGIPSCALQLVGLLQQMILVTYPDIEDNLTGLWQSTLISFAFLFLTVGFNVFLTRYLAPAETAILGVHAAGFIVFMAVFWSLAPRTASAYDVFTTFNNGGGWYSNGLSTFVGLTTPLWCFTGADAGAHMAEELKDASIELPRAMMLSMLVNGIMGVAMMITFCFCITDLEAVLDSEMPVITVLQGATNSNAGTIVLGCLLFVLLIFSTISLVATTSRQVWAFARDHGLPFSSWIQVVKKDIPINALYLCCAVSLALLAINFGSNVALGAILSVSNAALIFSYIISVGCIRLKRFRGEPLLPRRWSLGRWGWLVNDISLAFLAVSFVFSFFPQAPSAGDDEWAADFNWAIVIFMGTLVLALGLWFSGAKKRFIPPVALVKKQEDLHYQ